MWKGRGPCVRLSVSKGGEGHRWHAEERQRKRWEEGGFLVNTLRKTYKTSQSQSLLCSGAHSKCTHVRNTTDCLEGRNVIKGGITSIKQQKQKKKKKKTSNTGHIEVANTAAKLWKRTVKIEWYWSNQCWQIHTVHQCHDLDASWTDCSVYNRENTFFFLKKGKIHPHC